MVVAIEPVILPIRNLIRRVERHARWPDGRIHDGDRVDNPRFVFVPGGRPTIVATLDDHVKLVIVSWPVHRRKQPVADRIEVKAERIAKSVRPDGTLLTLRAAFCAGVGFDVACGGTNGSKLGAAAAPANRRPPVAPRTPAPPNVITTSASNRACMTRMFIARSRRPAVRSTRSGSSRHRQPPLREPLSVLIASGLRGDQLCP